MDVQDFSWAAPAAWPQSDGEEMLDSTEGQDEIVLDPGSASPVTVSNGVRLITAAQLGAGQASTLTTAPSPELEQGPAVSPDEFHHGMVVRHPNYGLGKIIALSGNGPKRTATVAFAQGDGEKRFILAHSPLRPAKNGG